MTLGQRLDVRPLVVADGGEVVVDRLAEAVRAEGEQPDAVAVEGVLEVLQRQRVVEDVESLVSSCAATSERMLNAPGMAGQRQRDGRAAGQLQRAGQQAAAGHPSSFAGDLGEESFVDLMHWLLLSGLCRAARRAIQGCPFGRDTTEYGRGVT